MEWSYYTDVDCDIPRASFPAPYQVVGSFLGSDVHGNDVFCKELIDLCDQIRAGKLKEWSGVGNAHEVKIKGDFVAIENIYDHFDFPPCTISIDVFRKVLEEWLVFIKEREATRPWLKSLPPE